MTSRDPSPSCSPRVRRHTGNGRSGTGSRGRMLLPVLAAAWLVVLGSAACSAPAPTVKSESSGSVSAAPKSPAADPSASTASDPAASGTAAAVEAALQSLVASAPQPSTAQVRESLAAAGFAPAAVEVSAARTPTGLAADAVEVGVLGDNNECVMAQVRSGTVATSILPVLPNGRCFIGSVQR